MVIYLYAPHCGPEFCLKVFRYQISARKTRPDLQLWAINERPISTVLEIQLTHMVNSLAGLKTECIAFNVSCSEQVFSPKP